MNTQQSIVWRKYPARGKLLPVLVLSASFVASGCSWLPLANSEISYRNPPQTASFLQPQSGMVLCSERSSATAMALTGFFADGCAVLAKRDRWRVVDVTYNDLGNGQTLWLAEVIDTEANATTDTHWAPIPWHDWA